MVPFRQAQGPEHVEGQRGQRAEDTKRKRAARTPRMLSMKPQKWGSVVAAKLADGRGIVEGAAHPEKRTPFPTLT